MLSPAKLGIIGQLLLLISMLSARLAVADPLGPGSVLCLHPLVVPLEEKSGEGRRLAIEQRLTEALVAASFTVPDPPAVSALTERVRSSAGGYIDPATGRRDKKRYLAFQDQLAGALQNELHCDAQLFAEVKPVDAPHANGLASWDGTNEWISSPGRVVLTIIGGVNESGWVAAFSLWLRAVDLQGNDLAFRSSGIEILAKLEVINDRDVVPQDLWLTDTTKIDAAIQSALGPAGDALRLYGTPAGADLERINRAAQKKKANERPWGAPGQRNEMPPHR